jgi:excinuclease UvrABC nuclease subunit
MKMLKYKSLTRTTLAELDDLPHSGIYIIAYMGRVLYVGKASESIADRLKGHVIKRGRELLGTWLDNMRFDWHNIRLDCLETPDYASNTWIQEAEAQLIRRFNPLFNIQNMV